jgi:hypothetical protein
MFKRLLALAAIIHGLHASVLAQQISLDELIAFRNADYDQINGTLLSRGWVFKGANDLPQEEGNSCTFQEAMWLYGAVSSEKANSFFAVDKGYGDCPNYVGYQTMDVSTFNKIRASIAKYKMEQVNSEVGNDEEGRAFVTTTYQGAKYKVLLTVYTSKDRLGIPDNFYGVGVYLKDSI